MRPGAESPAPHRGCALFRNARTTRKNSGNTFQDIRKSRGSQVGLLPRLARQGEVAWRCRAGWGAGAKQPCLKAQRLSGGDCSVWLGLMPACRPDPHAARLQGHRELAAGDPHVSRKPQLRTGGLKVARARSSAGPSPQIEASCGSQLADADIFTVPQEGAQASFVPASHDLPCIMR